MPALDLPVVPLDSFDDEVAKGHLQTVEFSADAALIRELGERLVGAPQIALAELVKNAYDADATECRIALWKNRIVVSDNGHGMTESDFRQFWMRIGTTNKRRVGRSSRLRRNLTGSKGVGRLSAQFLAHRLQLLTVSDQSDSTAFHALVDWDKAVTAGELTNASALFRLEKVGSAPFPRDSRHGTTVVLEGLKHDWTEREVRDLGRELWMLNSPFPRFGMLATGLDDARDFVVNFHTSLPGLDDSFQSQMTAAIESYYALIEGELSGSGKEGSAHVKVRFRDGDTYAETFKTTGLVHSAKWQIRVYDLFGRQASGVPVGISREYFEQFGVMVFDAGFRLPFYGISSDWLGIDYDQAHRLSTSELLPSRLQVERGLNDLPSQGRMLGVVSIDTGEEARVAAGRPGEENDYLQILVTRDRLIHNDAYRVLRDSVRRSIDYYATRQRSRKARIEVIRLPDEDPSTKVRRLASLVVEAATKFGEDPILTELAKEVDSLDDVVEQQLRADSAARALLGPLASAGMAALALEHENRKDIVRARGRIRALRKLAETRDDSELLSLIQELELWVDRLEASRKIFAPLMEERDRTRVEVLPAASTLREVWAHIRPLLPGVRVAIEVPKELELPSATFAEWLALFQNVLLNAANAMLDVDEPSILVTGGRNGRQAFIHVNDAGVGVDLDSQSQLFEPFSRQNAISNDRKELGLGGVGLGLTIVRMIAHQRRCSVKFIPPEEGWMTTLELSWTVS